MNAEALHRIEAEQAVVTQFRAMQRVLSLSRLVADAQQADTVMRSCIRMRVPDKKIIGPAFTVRLSPGQPLDCAGVLQQLKAGDVLVIDAFGETEVSVFGGLVASLCAAIGVVGAVVNGCVRDTDEARMIGFAIAARSVSPRSPRPTGQVSPEPALCGVRVVCGGVVVEPGDLIVADEIGISVVPRADIAQVFAAVRAQADREDQQRADFAAGATAERLLAKYGRV